MKALQAGFSFLLAVAVGVMVLLVGLYLSGSLTKPSAATITQLSAISKCDDLCSEDSIHGAVNLEGSCAYSDDYSFIHTYLNVEGMGKVNCYNLTECRMSTEYGICAVSPITFSKIKTCQKACEIDGGSYGLLSDQEPDRFPKLCELWTVLKTDCETVGGKKCIRDGKYFSKSWCS